MSVLATTQRALDVGGETIVSVAPMSLPDPATGVTAAVALRSEAIALFCARAEAASSGAFRLTDEAAPAVVEICRRLDGMPLAIEPAAARAGVLAPADIAERLEDRFSLLTRVPGALPARHQTLRAALDWSYNLLSPAEAALLVRLSVFTGGATLRAVEEVCTGGEVSRSEVLDLHASDIVCLTLATRRSGDR